MSDECQPMSFPEAEPPVAAIPRPPRVDAEYQLALELSPVRGPIREAAEQTSESFNRGPAEGSKGTETAALLMELQTAPNPQRALDPAWLLLKSPRGRCSILSELIAIVGEEAALKLVRAFGGTRLYVPHSPEPNDLLASTIGHFAATKLARIYGGDRVDVPNPPPRRIRIMQLRATGMSVDAIARELRCTRRRVFQVLAEARDPNRPV